MGRLPLAATLGAAGSPVKKNAEPIRSSLTRYGYVKILRCLDDAIQSAYTQPVLDLMNRGPNRAQWDFIVIGSGFGGAMAAHALVIAGHRVLMLERGDWVAREAARCDSHGSELTAHYSKDAGYKVVAGTKRYRARTWHCVGGQSVFYGGASYRFRETDFEHDSAIAGDSGAAWPFRYADIEPYYG